MNEEEDLAGHRAQLKNSSGWDGKLRLEKRAVIVNPGAISDPDYSEDDAHPQEAIAADEGRDIDLVHRGISSLPALRLQRFSKVERLCLRQNCISDLEFPETLGLTLKDLDLYDNLISHLKGLENLAHLTSLDLSFNKLKHIKKIDLLKKLTDLYLVQNKISKIEGLTGLTHVRNLELAANRIREIENIDTLTSLEELWLGKNKITQLKNLSSMSNLKILSIQSNRLSELEGLGELHNLEELYVSHNAIKQISGLETNKKLRVIDISNNLVSELESLNHLPRLEEFWASWNQFSSFEQIEREFSNMKHLTTVYFEGNPLQTKNHVTYRNKLRLALPQVKQIDATFVQLT